MKHSLKVAYAAAWLNKKLHINCSERDLIRGALLHDYFLYDWHDTSRKDFNPLHGFYHPGVALRNARKDFVLSDKEEDIISKHMWPMTVKPPKCREAWVVTAADKYISTLESLRLHNRSRMIRLRRRIIGKNNLHNGQKLNR
ncbi:MAG: HD domain-containing protein [Lachnospiraceae bacterium]|nr:HD domain-containing protein [Lachnospiraceae bacterium]